MKIEFELLLASRFYRGNIKLRTTHWNRVQVTKI